MLILHSPNQYDGSTPTSRPFPILAYLPSGDPRARLAIGGNNGSTCLWKRPHRADILPLVPWLQVRRFRSGTVRKWCARPTAASAAEKAGKTSAVSVSAPACARTSSPPRRRRPGTARCRRRAGPGATAQGLAFRARASPALILGTHRLQPQQLAQAVYQHGRG